MTAVQPNETQRQRPAGVWERWLLLALILEAFGRLVWQLDGKNLWWDESLSLQRAESAWLPLLQGRLLIQDGFSEMLTTDQHPFTYFALLGLLAHGAGESEFVLRYLSVMSATLLVAAVWACGRRLAVMGAAPAGTGLWAALVAAIYPFFLWYGQEARPYALWAMLAVLSTYLLLRVLAHSAPAWAWRAGYGLALFLFLTTHYFAVFLLPIQSVLIYQWMAQRNRSRALLVAGGVLVAGFLVGLAGAWLVLRQGGGGGNFERVPLRIMLPDLLNAFGLGLSVDIDQVWRLDVAIGVVALIGALWGLLDWRRARQGGWLLPAFVLLPVIALRLASLFQPIYMNARHLSLIGGGYVLLVGAGLAALWRFQRWLAAVLALVIVAGAGYSTYNYFTLPEYGKDDYTAAGDYLAKRILPGDLLLLNPPFSWRIFEYYLPVGELQHAAANGIETGVYAMPRLRTSWEAMQQDFETFRRQYRRIWMVTSGTYPFMDPEGRVETWLEENAIRLKDESFFSPTSFLDVELFLPSVPVYTEPPPMRERVDVVFGDQIRLLGYDLGPAITPQSAVPMTLYWQTLKPTEHHYKYVMRLVEQLPDGQIQTLATTEREPYDGVIPTIYWKPDEIIMEYSEIPPFAYSPEAAERYRILLQIYRADTLEKLAVTDANGLPVDADGQTLLLPYLPDLTQRDNRDMRIAVPALARPKRRILSHPIASVWNSERRRVGAVLAIYLVLALWYSVAVPPFETPDEVYHYAFARHVAQGNGLPVQTAEGSGPWEHEGSQAPLYYLLTGWLTSGIDQSDFAQLSVRNPRANIGDPLFAGNKNFMLYSAAVHPLTGANLALHVGRWVSIFLSTISLGLIYGTARLAFPDRRDLALLAALAAAAIPQFLFISASFSNDNMIIVTSLAVVYWLARLVAKDAGAPLHRWEWLVLGLLLGLAALSKLQGLGLWALAAGTGLALAWQRRDWRLPLRALLLAALPALAIAGWWYWRNATLYGDWLGARHLLEQDGKRLDPLSLHGGWLEFRGLRYSLWGLFGWFNILLPSWVYTLLDWVSLAALIGLLLSTFETWRARQMNSGASRVRRLLVAWALLSLAQLVYWLMGATSAQGRLLFPALSALAILLVTGLDAWQRRLPRSIQPWTRPALPALLFGCALYALLVLLPASYAAPQPLAANAIPPGAQRVDIVYGDKEQIRLLALEIPKGRFRPGDHAPITLYLTAPAPIHDDYQLFIQLLDENGVEVGNRTSHPGWGRHPTRLWQPGVVYADAYLVPISGEIDARAPLLARLYVGFINPATEEGAKLPLPARAGSGEEVVPFLGEIAISPAVQPEPEAYGLQPLHAHFGDVIDLAAFAQPAQVAAGATMTATLFWQATGTPPADYTAFVHLLDEEGNRVAGFDQAPAGARMPTSYWRAGDRIISEFAVAIPAETPAGDYTSWVGLYESASQGAARLPVTDAGPALSEHNMVLLGTVTIR